MRRVGEAISLVLDIGAERILHQRSTRFVQIKDGDMLALRPDRRPAQASDRPLSQQGALRYRPLSYETGMSHSRFQNGPQHRFIYEILTH
jgi:hypothetical protein